MPLCFTMQGVTKEVQKVMTNQSSGTRNMGSNRSWVGESGISLLLIASR